MFHLQRALGSARVVIVVVTPGEMQVGSSWPLPCSQTILPPRRGHGHGKKRENSQWHSSSRTLYSRSCVYKGHNWFPPLHFFSIFPPYLNSPFCCVHSQRAVVCYPTILIISTANECVCLCVSGHSLWGKNCRIDTFLTKHYTHTAVDGKWAGSHFLLDVRKWLVDGPWL